MRITSIFSILVLVIALAAGAFVRSWWYAGSQGDPVSFQVQKGENYVGLARRLEKAGLIRDDRAYRWYAYLFARGHVLKRGEYALAKGMPIADLVDILLSGKVIEYRFTIPEGSNLFQVAEKLEHEGLGHAEAFIAAARDPSSFKKIPTLKGENNLPKSVEGYLFPDTYLLQKVYSEREILEIFLERFAEKYKSLNLASMPTHLDVLHIRPHDLIILASIVEKETGAAKDRPVIASIFLNRLHKKMRLQSDPTTIYGMWVERGLFEGKIHKTDLQHPTPYNTYTISGLPAGPIASPGLDAIRAVLNPAQTNYLYFVSRNDGTTEFAADYKDHQRSVDRLQKDPHARDGKSWRNLPKEERANH